VRGGLTVSVAVANSDTNVGNVVGSPAPIAAGTTTTSGLAFHPKAAGTATLTITAPTGFVTPSNFQQVTAAVTAPSISISDVTVGKDLQTLLTISLQAAPPAPVTVTVTSADAAIASITANGTVAGGNVVTFTNVTTTTVGTLVVQGRSLGAVTLTAQAAGYTDGTSDVTVDPSGFFLNTGDFSVSASAANRQLNIGVGRLNPTTLNFVQSQALRGGLSIDVTITSSNGSVGTITGSPVRFNSGDSSNTSSAFDPSASGTATISVTPPTGFSSPSNFRQITATVTP
jgi:hypothetical protein